MTSDARRKKADLIAEIDFLKNRIEDLEQQSAQYQAIAEHTYDWESWIGPDGRLRWVNSAVERLTGYSLGDCYSMEDYPFPMIHEEDRARIRECLQQAAQGASQNDVTFRILRKDGSVGWGAVSWQPIEDGNGHPVGFRTSVRDITKRKLAEKNKEEVEKNLRALLDATFYSAFLMKSDGEIIDCNETLASTFRNRREEMIGENIYDYLGQEVASRRRDKVEEAIRSGESARFTDERDGHVLDNRICPICNNDGVIDRLAIYAVDITDSTRIRRALQDSEQRMRMILENMPVGMFQSTPEGKFIYVNSELAKMLGYDSAHELIMKVNQTSIAEALYEDPARRPILVKEASEAASDWRSFENRYVRKNGEVFVGLLQFCVREEPLTEQKFLYGFVKDITERKQQQEELLRNTELLLSIREAQTLYISQPDPAPVFERLLSTLVRMTGSEFGFLDEVLRDEDGSLYKMSLAMSDISWDEESRKLYQQLKSRNLEFRNLNNLAGLPATQGTLIISNDVSADARSKGSPKGHPPMKTFMGMPLYFAGELIGVAGVANRKEGYTERVAEFLQPLVSACAAVIHAVQNNEKQEQYLAALRESEERYRALVDNTPNSVLVLKEGRYIFSNPAGARLLGYSDRDELKGIDAMSTVHPASRQRIGERMRNAEQGSANPRIEIQIIRKDGTEADVESTSVPITVGGEPATLIIGQDITERKQAEQSQRALMQKAQQAQKYESLCRLAGGVAHHFNNLLHAVIGNLDLALAEMSSESPGYECIEASLEAAQQAAEISKQMLACSGHGHFLMKPLDPGLIISEMRHLLETRMDGKTRLALEIQKDLPRIKADTAQMRQLIINLVTNACEAMSEGGSLTIRAKASMYNEEKLKDEYLEFDLPAGRYVSMEVIDNGHGMDSETLSKVFDPFFSTKFIGRGLGMAAVLGIIRGHNGGIHVESQPGQGTTVHVIIPVLDETPETTQNNEKRLYEPQKSSPSVLIIDDEKGVLLLGRRMLEKMGYRTFAAPGGKEGIEIFSRHQNEIAFVLLDAQMPEIGGEVVFDQLRGMKPDVPIYLSTAYSEEQIDRHFQSKDLAGILKKPWKRSELEELLKDK